jgi:hypothetical protein
LEELVLMQQHLQRLIQSKAAGQQADSAVAIAAPDTAQASGSGSAAPLQRQDTSYGMSQPTNLAISGLIQLKGDAATTLSPRPASPRPTNTAGAGVTTPVVAGAGSATTATTSPAPTSATATPSPAPFQRKFFKRKFAGGPGAPSPITTTATTTTAATNTTADHSPNPAIAADMVSASVKAAAAEEGNGADTDGSDVSSPERAGRSVRAKHCDTARSSPSKVKFRLEEGAQNPNSSSKAATSATGARVLPAGIGRARASRVIRDDDGDVDAEAEFDDTDVAGTVVVSNSRGGGSGHGGNNGGKKGSAVASDQQRSDGSRDGNGKGEEGDRYGLPADLPLSLLTHLPGTFTELWHTLTAAGWFWKRGGGIVSYYYVRPGRQVKKGYVVGQDYFAEEGEVRQFVNTVVAQCRARMPVVVKEAPPLPPPPPPAPAAMAAPSTSSGGQASGSGGNGAAFVPCQHPRALASQPDSQQSVLQLPDDPMLRDIRRIPWKWLWKMLRARDWTWDFGPQHTNFYFAPGFDAKSKNAVLGVNKFDSEDAVRRFIRKQNWPEFSGGSLERQTSTAPESQAPDAYLHDPNWGLASHRRKREHTTAAVKLEDGGGDSDGADSEGERGSGKHHGAGRSSKGGSRGSGGGGQVNKKARQETSDGAHSRPVTAHAPQPRVVAEKVSGGADNHLHHTQQATQQQVYSPFSDSCVMLLLT